MMFNIQFWKLLHVRCIPSRIVLTSDNYRYYIFVNKLCYSSYDLMILNIYLFQISKHAVTDYMYFANSLKMNPIQKQVVNIVKSL